MWGYQSNGVGFFSLSLFSSAKLSGVKLELIVEKQMAGR